MGDDEYNYKVDIWALGIILYLMIFQKLPFIAKSMNRLLK